MSSGNLVDFVAYRKALDLFDSVIADMDRWMTSHRLDRLVSQQIASAAIKSLERRMK